MTKHRRNSFYCIMYGLLNSIQVQMQWCEHMQQTTHMNFTSSISCVSSSRFFCCWLNIQILSEEKWIRTWFTLRILKVWKSMCLNICNLLNEYYSYIGNRLHQLNKKITGKKSIKYFFLIWIFHNRTMCVIKLLL